MPLIMILRCLLSVASLFVLAALGYLAWTWYQGDYVRDVHGTLYLVRENWRLWTVLALAAWSFGGGGILIRPLLAKRDTDPLDPKRGVGQTIPGANGASLYVEAAGPADAPVIVLTHGWGLDSTIWNYAKRDLSRRFRVITWDLPGMGLSKAPASAVNLESFAANLKIVIRHTGADRVVLVGHSIGGMATQTLARDDHAFFNRHVAGTVLVNTTYRNPLTTMILHKLALLLRFPAIEPMMHLTMWLWPLAWLGAWKSYLDGTAHIANRLGFGAYVTHSQLAHTTLLTIRNPQRAQAKGNLAMFGWDATGAMRSVAGPVLLLAGSADIVTKADASIAIASAAPAATVEIIDKVNHMGFLERADVYNPAIAAFASKAFDTDAFITAYRPATDADPRAAS